MTHKKYPKIYRLGMEENEGILDQEVVIEEKIDGANLSVWLDDGELKIGSRNNDITDKEDGFNGAVEYCKNSEPINNYLRDNPNHRLFGEWLVRHTVNYSDEAYNKFYLYDIVILEKSDKDGEYYPTFLTRDEIRKIINDYGFYSPIEFARGKFSEQQIKEFAGKTVLGVEGEGVVIKPLKPFLNKFGRNVYAKYVTERFKENNDITFGSNNKHSDTYNEMYIVNKYITISRIQKAINNLEAVLDHKPNIKDTPRVMNTVYHDMITEEIWGIIKKVKKIDFKVLQRLASKKIVQVYHDMLSGDISIVDKNK